MNTNKQSPAMMTLAVLAFGLMVYGEAEAHSHYECGGNTVRWSGARATMAIDPVEFPAGGDWDVLLRRAASQWNNVKGSSFTFTVKRDTDTKHKSGNGSNEVYFDGGFDPGVLAYTQLYMHCYWAFGYHYGIDEADVVFNEDLPWSTGLYSYSTATTAPFSFEGVALHELGHALGLDHENDRLATMNTTYPNGGPLGSSREWDPYGDDRGGVRVIYPDSTTSVDVAASALKYLGNGISTLVSSPSSAFAGSSIAIQYTMTNLGTSSKTVDVAFYLSPNSNISTADLFLGRNHGIQVAAGGTGTFIRTLFIPAVAPRTYYIGLIVDPDKQISESNELNNTQVMPRTITIK